MSPKALVALGGGPSPVINASLAGVIERCRDYPAITGLYAAWHGVEGILREELIDLDGQDRSELDRLKQTPASGAIGTCRYKLGEGQQEDFDRIIDVLQAHGIGYFFYIGGNDTMDTADKVSRLAHERGFDLVVTGVPKTIDNDLGDEARTIIDHTPGYGSAARYWAMTMQNTEEENRGMSVSECVSVWQAMGRKSGFITAAARLADPERRWPLQLYFAEAGHNLDSLTEHVNQELVRSGRCIVVVNEGFDVGHIGAKRDGFGHIEYGASEQTAAQIVVNHLNKAGLKARGQATGQVPGILQRASSIHRSVVDIEEAWAVGAHAVEVAMTAGTGFMATILRVSDDPYQVRYDQVPLRTVANSERFLPPDWISPDGLDVTDAFIRYARPLIGRDWPHIPLEDGLQRFARLNIRFIAPRCPTYMPAAHRPETV
ncbi:MAG: diphosphate--fructose-6-phosphate 1-phosphotransferase [Clostridiaceae bacterium]|jgi:6-phosphofructokinase 1|nr:diphosphate--fructose-6-phosphate 1-phosphotransferase [Clostridiaceae bacterium]